MSNHSSALPMVAAAIWIVPLADLGAGGTSGLNLAVVDTKVAGDYNRSIAPARLIPGGLRRVCENRRKRNSRSLHFASVGMTILQGWNERSRAPTQAKSGLNGPPTMGLHPLRNCFRPWRPLRACSPC